MPAVSVVPQASCINPLFALQKRLSRNRIFCFQGYTCFAKGMLYHPLSHKKGYQQRHAQTYKAYSNQK